MVTFSLARHFHLGLALNHRPEAQRSRGFDCGQRSVSSYFGASLSLSHMVHAKETVSPIPQVTRSRLHDGPQLSFCLLPLLGWLDSEQFLAPSTDCENSSPPSSGSQHCCRLPRISDLSCFRSEAGLHFLPGPLHAIRLGCHRFATFQSRS